jgi:hypothetical protein
LFQPIRGAHDQVVSGQCGAQIFAADLAIGTQVKVQGVTPVDQHEDRLQEVVSVWTPPSDVQKQVQFGWRQDIM